MSKKLIAVKIEERIYPVFCPHIILGTNQSILDDIPIRSKPKFNIKII